MANAFRVSKKGAFKMYSVPDIMRQTINLKMLSEDGIFYNGECFSKMYHLQIDSQEKIPFEGFFALLRKENIRFQCRKEYPDGKNYLTLFCQETMVDKNIPEFFRELEQMLSNQIIAAKVPVKVLPIDGNTRLRMLHVMLMNERKSIPANYLVASSWLKDLKMSQISWKDAGKFKRKGEYQKVYLICTISEECEELYSSIEKIPGISLIISEFSAISDSSVIKRMESLYLDIKTVFAKLRKRNPDLYNAYVNGAKVDTYGYTLAGMLVLLSSPTEDKLRDSEYLLLQEAKANHYQMVTLYGKQRSSYLSMLPAGTYPIQTRIHPTDEVIEFFPFIYEITGRENANGI